MNRETLKLTPDEQARLYQAVSASMRAEWKRRDESILYQWFFKPSLTRQMFRYKYRTPSEIEEIERGIEFREEYNGMRRVLLLMKRKNLVKFQQTEQGYVVKLTKSGNALALKRLIRAEKKKLPLGHYCYVIFDIPQNVKPTRDALRYFLKNAGFELVQRSVWKSDRDVLAHLKLFLKETGIDRWVTVLEGIER